MCGGRVGGPQSARREDRRAVGQSRNVIEQMLYGDGVPDRKRNGRHDVADALVETEPPFRGHLMDHRRGHRFADRADLEERVGSDRRTRVGVRKAEILDRPKAIGGGESRGSGRAARKSCGGLRPERGLLQLPHRGRTGPELAPGAQLAAEREAKCSARERPPAKLHGKSLPRRLLIEGRGGRVKLGSAVAVLAFVVDRLGLGVPFRSAEPAATRVGASSFLFFTCALPSDIQST